MKKTTSLALTPAERKANQEAQDALRTGRPVSATARRHLATALRKYNLHRYGRADAFAHPPAVTEHGLAHF
jgi:hypothetical protein